MGCGLSSDAAGALTVPTNPDEALEFALRHGDSDALQKALDTHANVNRRFKDDQGQEYTALHVAAKLGNLSAINLLLKASADVRVEDSRGNTALHIAAKHDRPDALSALVDAGSEVDVVNQTQLTPLATALTNHSSSALQRLIQLGASVDGVPECPEPPILTAAKMPSASAVVALLQANAKYEGLMVPSLTEGESLDLLTWATKNGYTEVEQALNARQTEATKLRSQMENGEAPKEVKEEVNKKTEDDIAREEGDGAEDILKANENGLDAATDDTPAEVEPTENSLSSDQAVDTEADSKENGTATDGATEGAQEGNVAPAQETSNDEAQADEAPTDDAPTDDAPVDDAPADDEQAADTPTDDAPTDSTPADDAPANDPPANGGEADEAPKDTVPAENGEGGGDADGAGGEG